MTPAAGLVLLCDLNGSIRLILRDDGDFGEKLQIGGAFARLAAPGNLDKALSFLVEINSKGMAFGWEINISADEQIKTLHFAGGKVNDQLLIVGAENSLVTLQLYEEMMRINNEQTNALRSAHKENARDDSLYDEISSLNNELVSMQRELAKKNAELERLNHEKNRFVGMAAHDLRSPLQVCMLASQFLLSITPASEDGTTIEFLQSIYSSLEFMARLVDDMLDVTKIEAGELQLDVAPLDLVALVKKNAALNQPLAARKQIEIRYSLEPLPPAVVDGAKIEQVLNNLISNAVKFSLPGSQVEIRLKRAEDRFVLEVADQGHGMSAAEVDQLFTPFQRGRAGTSGEKSTGLGLVIVKRIVEGHGGKIWLESQEEKGSTFFVSIPFGPLSSA